MKTGFTLIELVIAIAVLTILTAVTLSADMHSFQHYSFRDERDAFVTTLQKARAESMSGICVGTSCTDSRAHGVYITSSHYVLFQGSAYMPEDDTNVSFPLNPAVSTAGFSEVVFTRLSGDVSVIPSGTSDITLTDTSGNSSTVTINPEGQISWTN